MGQEVKLKIDGKECLAKENDPIVNCAKDHGVYIPTLCNYYGIEKCLGTCRVCTVKANGRYVAACVQPVLEGMEVEVNTAELADLRKGLIEMHFVEGNHFCPGCEKSGDCDLQALAYRMKMFTPRFPFNFNNREIDLHTSNLMALEFNRCVLCQRCFEEIKSDDGQKIFAIKSRGHKSQIHLDPVTSKKVTMELAQQAADLCPVGAILVKGKGFDRPYGKRKYDKDAIGADIQPETDVK